MHANAAKYLFEIPSWRSIIGGLALVGTALALAAPAAANPPNPVRVDAALRNALSGDLPAEGIAIGVTLRPHDLPSAEGAARRAAVNARQGGVLNALPAGGLALKHRYRSLAGFAGAANRQSVEALMRHPDVESVYVDGIVHAALAEGVHLIGADTAHALGITGAGVKIAVLDTGIDTDHPDLADDLVAQHCFCDTHPSPARGACCPGTASNPKKVSEGGSAEDDEGHGTAVAGIITSSGAAAAVGVARDAEIVAVKVLSSTGSGTFSDIAAGLDWILTERTDPGSPAYGTAVVNMSIGDGGEYGNPASSPCSGSNTANAISALHAAGVVVVVASGNEGHDNGISFPACVADAISVGGVYDANVGSVSWCGNSSCTQILCTDNPTFADKFVCHSNSDEILDILAPDYRTTTSGMGGGTVAFGGTSAASPYAAAEVALMLQVNPALTPGEIRSHLKANGSPVTNPDNGLTFNRTQLSAILPLIDPPVCGNTIVEVGEDCDDGGAVDGDCCSSACTFETGACDDGNACTTADACDGAGGCTPGPALPCDDGLFCNGSEDCEAAVGCLPGAPPGLDDAVGCTDDWCDEANDIVVHAPNDSLCNDAEFCNGPEVCDAVNDCQAGAPVPTDDGVACTDDLCDGAGELITHSANDLLCDDTDACTADTCDAQLGCAHEPIAFCGTGVSATPRRGAAVLAAILVSSGGLLLAGKRRAGRRGTERRAG